MKIKSLIRSLPFVAKALGDKMGVKVQVSGDGAWTNGDVINIPILPEDNEKAAILARGYLDHETGHVRFTECTHTSNIPVAHELANAIEDIRIEKLMGETFPGCRSNLDNLTNQMVQDGLMSFPEGGEIPAVQAVIGWIHAKLEVEVLGRHAMQPVMNDAQEILEEIFPSHWIPLLGDMVEDAKKCSSTREVVTHAEKIIHTLKNWATNPPPPPPGQPNQQPDANQNGGQGDSKDQQAGTSQGDSQNANPADSPDRDSDDQNDSNTGSESGSDDDSDSKSNGSNQMDDAQDDSQDDKGSSKGDKQDPQKEGGQTSGQSEDQSSSPSNGAGAGNGLDQEQIAKTIEQILNASEEDCKGFDLGEILKEALGNLATGETVDAICIPREERPQTGVVDVHRVRATTAALSSRLTGLVQASRHQSCLPKRTGRKVDTRVLTRLAKKDPRVFKDEQIKAAVNTAVVILLDRSGSMGGTKIAVALDAVLASSLALDAIPGVSVCTAAFPGGQRGWEAQVVPMTRFGQSVRATTKHYCIDATGGTPLAEALYWGASQLLNRPEPRKIVLVATDGEPNDPAATQSAINRLANEGIELLGLGIQHQGVANYFRNHAVVQNLTELPKAVFGMLQSELVRKSA